MKEREPVEYINKLELNGLNCHTLPDGEYKRAKERSIYAIECTNMSERFIKALAKAHDSITTYGKAGEKEDTGELNDLDYLGNEHVEPQIRVLLVKENWGDPGDDYIVIYNWEGVLRMTGLMSDSHNWLSVYKVSDNLPQVFSYTDLTEASHLTLEDI